jgi:hypothetical protein
MLRAPIPRPLVPTSSVFAACLLTALASPFVSEARGQQLRSSETAPAKLSVDVEAVLQHPALLPERVSGPAWRLEPRQQRRLVQVPFCVHPDTEPARLSQPAIRLSGARFVAWRFPHQGAGKGAFPGHAPRLFRRAVVHSDGTLEWDLARAIPGAELAAGGNPYELKLRPQRLRQRRPQHPDEAGTNRNNRQDREAERQARQEYRRKLEQFRQTRQRIDALPETFTQPPPQRLWAIFEIRADIDTLELESRGDEGGRTNGGVASAEASKQMQLLPWELSLKRLRLARQVTGAPTAGLPGDDVPPAERIGRLADWAEEGHPLSHRLVALAMKESELASDVPPRGPHHALVERLLSSTDAPARRAVAEALAAAGAPGKPAADLLRRHFDRLGPHGQLAALDALLQRDWQDREVYDQFVARANRLLHDEASLPVESVLSVLTERLDSSESGRSAAVLGITFGGMPPERQRAAARFVAEAAGESELAGRWLEQSLLDNPRLAVVETTLNALSGGEEAVADTGQSKSGAISGEAAAKKRPTDGASGSHGASADTSSEADRMAGGQQATKPGSPVHQTPASDMPGPPPMIGSDQRPGEAPRTSDTTRQPTAREESRVSGNRSSDEALVPLTTPDHPLLDWLTGDDADRRSGAWRSLQHFRLPKSTEADGGTVVERILAAALDEEPTPPEAVAFFRRQPGSVAAVGLARLAAEDSRDAGLAAARAFIGTDRSLADAFDSLQAADRVALGRRLYEAAGRSVSPAVGLLAVVGEPNPVSWFAARVADGDLPATEAWAEPFEGEAGLLRAVQASAGREPIAEATAAVLLARAEAPAEEAEAIGRVLAKRAGESVEALREAYREALREVRTRQLRGAGGRYRLAVRVERENGTRRHVLGQVQLVADGRSVRLATETLGLAVAVERPGIELVRPAELNNFGHDALNELPLGRLDGALTLRSQDDGRWAGEAALPDGGNLRVFLEPIGS